MLKQLAGVAVVWLAFAAGMGAQSPAAPAANAADVAHSDSIVQALYNVISGPAGPRDWNRFRALFAPGARLMAVSRGTDGKLQVRVLTPEDYIARAAPSFEKAGFFEREASRKSESYGSIMHIFSAYESRHAVDDAQPFARGTNSIQLFNDGSRWYVVTVYWDQQR
jgi:hypothetical protein